LASDTNINIKSALYQIYVVSSDWIVEVDFILTFEETVQRRSCEQSLSIAELKAFFNVIPIGIDEL
jgi:hypothetical protein